MVPHTPESLLAMARQFMDARVFLSGAELGLFELLADTALTVDEIVSRKSLDRRGAGILLDALTAMGFLEKTNGAYTCPAPTASMLASIMPMVMHVAGLWHRWTHITDIVRGIPSPSVPGNFGGDGQLAAFIGAMHVIGARMAPEVVNAVGPGDAKALLDVGGASGTYTEAFLKACPAMCATLFDRAPVIELARARLGETELMERITLVPGDFYEDELPGGHDLVFLSAIIHQNSPQENIDLYRKCHRALVPGGRLVIRDHVMDADHVHPVSGALFAVNMLAATPGGGTYTFGEIQDTLQRAGFVRIRQIQAGDAMNGLVEAFK